MLNLFQSQLKNLAMTTVLILPIILLLIGLALLVWSSDVFIDGAASTAVHLAISPLVIGVVVLGFGTSMPEIIVSTLASLEGSPGLAVGNVVGSNIANIGLVLGITALIAPVVIKSSLLKRELPVLLATSVGAFLLTLDGELSLLDGMILVVALVLVMIWMIRVNKAVPSSDPIVDETVTAVESHAELTLKKALISVAVGLILLMISAKMMVWGAVEIAVFFEVPEVIIGLTIIAIGTSLPELAAAISAARKNEYDLLIGNIIGSNLFNTLAVLAVPAILAPGLIDKGIVYFDFPIMLGFTLALLLLAIPKKGKAIIGAPKGLLLMSAFMAYLAFLYFRTVIA